MARRDGAWRVAFIRASLMGHTDARALAWGRNPTGESPMRLRRPTSIAPPAGLAAALLIVLCLSACGDDGGTGGGPAATTAPATTTATTAPATTTAPQPAEVAADVYFVRDERMAAAARQVATPAVARGAMAELLRGPGEAEAAAGMSSSIPAGTTLRGLRIVDGVAEVDLSGEFASGGGSLSMLTRVAQVVYTLTGFPTVELGAVPDRRREGRFDRGRGRDRRPPADALRPARPGAGRLRAHRGSGPGHILRRATRRSFRRFRAARSSPFHGNQAVAASTDAASTSSRSAPRSAGRLTASAAVTTPAPST